MDLKVFVRIQNHPVIVTLFVASAALSTVTGLDWCGRISASLFVFVVVLLVLALGAAALYAVFAGRHLVSTAGTESYGPAVQSGPSEGSSPSASGELPLIAPEPCTSQQFYLEAFEAMASGRFKPRSSWRFDTVGKQIIDWINLQYQRHVDAYPGSKGVILRQRLGELAFREIKTGNLIHQSAAVVVIPEVEQYVAARVVRTTT